MNKNNFYIITNSCGYSKFFAFLFILIVVSAIYLSYLILPHYLSYLSFKDLAQSKVFVSQVVKDENVLNDLYNKAKELDLPLERGDIIVKRNSGGLLSIYAQWVIEVEFIGGYKRNFNFIVDVGS